MLVGGEESWDAVARFLKEGVFSMISSVGVLSARVLVVINLDYQSTVSIDEVDFHLAPMVESDLEQDVEFEEIFSLWERL